MKKIFIPVILTGLIFLLQANVFAATNTQNRNAMLKEVSFSAGQIIAQTTDVSEEQILLNIETIKKDVYTAMTGTMGKTAVPKEDYALTAAEIGNLIKNVKKTVGADITIEEKTSFKDATAQYLRAMIYMRDNQLDVSGISQLEELYACFWGLQMYLVPNTDFEQGCSIKEVLSCYRAIQTENKNKFSAIVSNYRIKLDTEAGETLMLTKLVPVNDKAVVEASYFQNGNRVFMNKPIDNASFPELPLALGTNLLSLNVSFTENDLRVSRSYTFSIDYAKSDSNLLTGFTLNGRSADINQQTGQVRLTLPASMKLGNPDITAVVSKAASYDFIPEKPDFIKPFALAVTSESGFVRTYIVSIEKSDKISYPKSFSDINNPSVWYYSYVLEAAEKGLLPDYGDGMFNPLSFITGEELALIFNHATGIKDNKVISDFSSKNTVTREELAYLCHSVINGSQNTNGVDLNSVFTDYAETNGVYAESVRAVYNMNIMTGRAKDRFEPKAYVTKAEAASVILRLLRHV